MGKKNERDEKRREKKTLSQNRKPQCKRKDIENGDEERQWQQRRTTKIFQSSNTDSAVTMAARFVLLLLLYFFFSILSSFVAIMVLRFRSLYCLVSAYSVFLSFFLLYSLPSISFSHSVVFFLFRRVSPFVCTRHMNAVWNLAISSVHVTKYTFYTSKS